MNRRDTEQATGISRREFLGASTAALALPLIGCGSTAASMSSSPSIQTARRSSHDPWLEIDRSAFHHNVREASRLAGGRPILAVVKNNAYGLGDAVVGPLLAECDEVAGIACVRVAEAIGMRQAGVRKPILNMAEVSEEETEELARHQITSSVWLDDAPKRMERVAKRIGRAVPIHMYIDTGIGREGMPYYRAQSWVETLCRQQSVRVDGTYTMFTHDLEFDHEQFRRFQSFLNETKAAGLALGTLHAAPTYELFLFPESHLEMVRPGNALFGNYPSADGVKDQAELRSVFRLRARITRLEQLRPGDGAGFRREYIAQRPTWIALLPVGHTDGYPVTAANTCHVLIRDRLYPVVGNVNSAHTYVEIGEEKSVEIGDTATLIGPDHPEIDPQAVAVKTGVRFLLMITKFNARLPRYVV